MTDLFDWAEYATARNVRQRELDAALTDEDWDRARGLLLAQDDDSERLRRWLDQQIVQRASRNRPVRRLPSMPRS